MPIDCRPLIHRWSSTNRQNPLNQQNCRNVWTSNAILMNFKILNLVKSSNKSILWLKAPSLTIRAWLRRKDIYTNDLMNEWMNEWMN